MIRQLHYPTAFKALDLYIDAYNERTENSGERIKSAVVLAAKEIIRVYGAFLLKTNALPSADISTLPPLRTNNHQLAGLIKCSARSVQRYLHRLLAAEIITEKVFHGSNSSYELWINPKVLLLESTIISKATRELLIQSAEKVVDSALTTNCPHTYTSNDKINIIKDVHNVDNAGTLDKKGYAAGYSVAGHTGEKGCYGEKEEKGGGGPPDPTRTAALEFHVQLLWTLARNVLYQDTYITNEQAEIAKQHLVKYYETVETNKLTRVHEIYIERIGLVSKYLKKDPLNRYVQLPHRYFDTDNPGGFIGTKKWWYHYNERKKETQKKLILNAQVKKYQRNLQSNNPKQRPALAVYRECEQRISKCNDPLLLQQFHAQILTPDIYNRLHPSK